MKNQSVVLFLIVVVLVGYCIQAQAARSPYLASERASQNPDSAMKLSTDQDVKVALGMIKEADALVKKDMSAQNMRTALPLYVRAGQMLEKSMLAYQKLGQVQMATFEDFNNTNGAMNYCVQTAKTIQKRLNR